MQRKKVEINSEKVNIDVDGSWKKFIPDINPETDNRWYDSK